MLFLFKAQQGTHSSIMELLLESFRSCSRPWPTSM